MRLRRRESWEEGHKRNIAAFRTAPDKPLALLRARHDLYRLEGLVASLGAGQWVALLGLAISLLAIVLGAEKLDVAALTAAGVVAAGSAAGLLVSVYDAGSKLASQRLLVEALEKLLP